MSQKQSENADKRRREHYVVNECNGIIPFFEAFYIESIAYSATAARDAFDRFATSVLHDCSPAEIVSAIQEALTHSAGLSRFFWPACKTALSKARAEKLRKAFDMDGSALEQRCLRNAIEHFDERLDEFLLKEPVGYFFPGPLVECHEMADEKPGQIFSAC